MLTATKRTLVPLRVTPDGTDRYAVVQKGEPIVYYNTYEDACMEALQRAFRGAKVVVRDEVLGVDLSECTPD